QEQVDLTERLKQEEAEEKRRLAEQQRAEKLKQLQAERARVEREAKLAEQKLRQIADARARQASDDAAASAPPPPGNNGVDTGLQARYAAAIQAAVLRNWTRPENIPQGQRCRIYITQLPGGDVMSAKVDPSCPYDEMGRRSVEAAVLKAKPLPYAGFESVFQRNLILNFEPQARNPRRAVFDPPAAPPTPRRAVLDPPLFRQSSVGRVLTRRSFADIKIQSFRAVTARATFLCLCKENWRKEST